MKLCPYCSQEIKKTAKVCTHCGRKIEEEKEYKEKVYEEKQQERNHNNVEDFVYQTMGYEKIGPFNKWITLLLCIFLGIFGAHKFYERKYTIGLLYLVTGGFCFLGVILDIYLILQKPTEYYVYRQPTTF